VTRITEGFSHFVTSIAAPVASGWSGCRVGLAPTGKRHLFTAHTRLSHSEKIYDRPLSDRQKTVGDICFPAARWSTRFALSTLFIGLLTVSMAQIDPAETDDARVRYRRFHSYLF
jgi:hypothetical protein